MKKLSIAVSVLALTGLCLVAQGQDTSKVSYDSPSAPTNYTVTPTPTLLGSTRDVGILTKLINSTASARVWLFSLGKASALNTAESNSIFAIKGAIGKLEGLGDASGGDSITFSYQSPDGRPVGYLWGYCPANTAVVSRATCR